MTQRWPGSGDSSQRERVKRSGGFSLIELVIASFVLTVAVCGVSGSMVSALTLNRVNRETALAQEAVRRAMESAHGIAFEDVFATYNLSAADDPVGGGAGRNFAVFGLTATDADADGFVGEITFPTLDVGGVEQLREDIVDAELGMPRDLNGDGVQDALDHSGDYRLLPIRVRVAWRGVSGDRMLTAEGMLSAR